MFKAFRKICLLRAVKWFSKQKFYAIQIFFQKKSESHKISVY
jgi:hypothetical protein